LKPQIIPLLVKDERQKSAFVTLADYWENLREGRCKNKIKRVLCKKKECMAVNHSYDWVWM
jgi:hypothetical protein